MRGLNANTGQLDCYTNAAKDHSNAFCLGQSSDDCARLHTYEALQTQAWALQGHAASVTPIALDIALATGSQLQLARKAELDMYRQEEPARQDAFRAVALWWMHSCTHCTHCNALCN